MKKVLIAVVVVILLLPVIPYVIPKAMTFDRIETGLKKAGFNVRDVQPVANPGLRSVEEVSMIVNGARVDVYRFDDRGKIATEYEYQKPDVGSAIVENWNLSESLGAAKPKKAPITPVQRGLFMMVITDEDVALRNRIAEACRNL